MLNNVKVETPETDAASVKISSVLDELLTKLKNQNPVLVDVIPPSKTSLSRRNLHFNENPSQRKSPSNTSSCSDSGAGKSKQPQVQVTYVKCPEPKCIYKIASDESYDDHCRMFHSDHYPNAAGAENEPADFDDNQETFTTLENIDLLTRAVDETDPGFCAEKFMEEAMENKRRSARIASRNNLANNSGEFLKF